MTDHYETPHARADECPHAGVGKACRPCRNHFDYDPITPDERAAMREAARFTKATIGLYGRTTPTQVEVDYADTVLRLLNALEATEYERDGESVAARLNLSRAERAEAEIERLVRPCDGDCYADGPAEDCSAHGRPVAEVWKIVREGQRQRDEARAEVALLRAEIRRDLARFNGPTRSTPVRDEDTVAKAVVRDLLPVSGESRAQVQAEALRDAARAAVSDGDDCIPWSHDHDRATVASWLDARADRTEKGKTR